MSETAVHCFGAAARLQVFRHWKTSSIDTEPRTLNEQELHSARQAAVDILQKKEPDEARHIFTKGLKPVVSVREMESMVLDKGKQYDWQDKEQAIIPLQCTVCLCVVNDEVLPVNLQCSECAQNNRTENEGPSSAPF